MRRQVEAWVDGELRGSAVGDVRDHLEECWGCSGDAELLRLLKVALSRLGQREPTALASARLRRWASRLEPGSLG